MLPSGGEGLILYSKKRQVRNPPATDFDPLDMPV
jgi:hypothetical protein